jgi:hypothetical protein
MTSIIGEDAGTRLDLICCLLSFHDNAVETLNRTRQKSEAGFQKRRSNIEMNNCDDASARCCAECGKEGGVSLKTCKACMSVRYCNASCQHKHWPKHKIPCKERAAKLRNEALFKDPRPKEDCPICFIPMPILLISCISLPPATMSSVPIYDFAIEHQELAQMETETYYSCCGKSICDGCIYSFIKSGNDFAIPTELAKHGMSRLKRL